MTNENKLQVCIYMNINLLSEISLLVNIKMYRELKSAIENIAV